MRRKSYMSVKHKDVASVTFPFEFGELIVTMEGESFGKEGLQALLNGMKNRYGGHVSFFFATEAARSTPSEKQVSYAPEVRTRQEGNALTLTTQLTSSVALDPKAITSGIMDMVLLHLVELLVPTDPNVLAYQKLQAAVHRLHQD